MDNKNDMSKLNVGLIVGYVLPGTEPFIEIRPAIVTRVWDEIEGTSNLNVFVDGENDAGQDSWATSVVHSADKVPGTWHFLDAN